jgi:membrane-associated phospholipid phosphatase
MNRIINGKRIRHEAADRDYPFFPSDNRYDHPTNGEEDDYRDLQGHHNYIGNFSKVLPHHTAGPEIGEVKPYAYRRLLAAVDTGNPDDFDNIPRVVNDACARKFVNPQSGLAFDLEGPDSHSLIIPPAPRIDGSEAASEMAELYWMALCRDINFNDFNGTPIIASAAADLDSNYNRYTGPRPVTPSNVFRGNLNGDLVGPYVSQFLLRGNNNPTIGRVENDGFIQYGTLNIDQRQATVRQNVDFIDTFNEWLDLQQGIDPRAIGISNNVCQYRPDCGTSPVPLAGDHRGFFIRNMRDLANYVHIDDLPQEFLNACLILKHLGVPPNHGPPCAPQPHGPVDGGNPYIEPNPDSQNQEAIATFGDQYIFTLVAEVARRALYAAWFQKWFVHRRLRPEEFGGLIHKRLAGVNGFPPASFSRYPINPEILTTGPGTVLNRVNATFGSFLLPQAYPEGCPPHPSYPSGHATIAGACVTVLKAYFDESYTFKKSYQPNAAGTGLDPATDPTTGNPLPDNNLTIGDELNKLASNIALGRNMAGIHYRSDYLQGVLLGEEVAIGILQDQLETYNEDYSFTFTRFNGGTKIIRKR